MDNKKASQIKIGKQDTVRPWKRKAIYSEFDLAGLTGHA